VRRGKREERKKRRVYIVKGINNILWNTTANKMHRCYCEEIVDNYVNFEKVKSNIKKNKQTKTK
jgi:hypothetical protein